MRISYVASLALPLSLVSAQNVAFLGSAIAGIQSILVNTTDLCLDQEAAEQSLTYYADMIKLATSDSYQAFFCGEERSLFTVLRETLFNSLTESSDLTLPSITDIVFATFDAAELAGIPVYAVNDVESLERGGLPRNLYSRIITSPELVEIAEDANAIGTNIQAGYRAQIEMTEFGRLFEFDDVQKLALQILTETTFARYLETSDDGETYSVICGPNGGNAVVRALWDSGSFSDHIQVPGPDGAQINLGRNADGALEVTDTSDDAANRVLGCIFDAEEAYHGGLHFIEGSLQNSITAGVFDDDAFVKTVLNFEQRDVQQKYGDVRVLTRVPSIVWKEGLTDAITKDVLVPLISGALLDFKTLNPLANIPADRLEDFPIPLRDIYQQIVATDFGYGTETKRMYVATGTSVDAPTNNLLQLQMMVAMLHTDTFVWQHLGALAPAFTTWMSLGLSPEILSNVVFPDLENCLSTTFDASKAYSVVVGTTYEENSPSEVGRAALETYANWLSNYRANGLTGSGLTGLAMAFSDTECMSVTTWV